MDFLDDGDGEGAELGFHPGREAEEGGMVGGWGLGGHCGDSVGIDDSAVGAVKGLMA